MRAVRILLLSSLLAFPQVAFALPVPMNPEASIIANLTAAVQGHTAMPGLVVEVGRQFLGRPYIAHTLDQPGEPLTCRLDGFDCVTFVESSVALARAIAGGSPSEAAFHEALTQLRYRDGVRSGYGSRLHYFSDWIADNARRGLVEDLTPSLGGVEDTRQIDFMSTHREAYPLLADNAAFQLIESAEQSINARPRYMIPKDHLEAVLPMLETGDIVGITTNIAGLDVVHTGLVDRLPDGSVHLLHAPEPGTSVCVSTKPLVEYLQGFKAHTGVMIARPLPPQ
ncbi:MAG TPA: N-acetylmuramoyl-L-alanine amidase-like domain-containing protein [Oscillatoriaceae cyanobacterium]